MIDYSEDSGENRSRLGSSIFHRIFCFQDEVSPKKSVLEIDNGIKITFGFIRLDLDLFDLFWFDDCFYG